MLQISKRTCIADTPRHFDRNKENNKKIEYRTFYIAYLNIHNAIPMGCLVLLELWLLMELHISTNPHYLNIFWINAFFYIVVIWIGFKLIDFEDNLHNCGDNRRFIYILQKNGRGKKKIYV